MTWRRFFRRGQWDRDRAEELRSYLEIETDENIARGMSPEAARRVAHLKLGNTVRIREEIYRMNTISPLDTLGRDLRLAVGRHAAAPRVHRRGGLDARPRHRREYGNLQRGRWRVDQAAVLPERGGTGQRRARRTRAQGRRVPDVAVAVLHVSRGESRLSAHRSLRRRRPDDHRRRRAGTGARTLRDPRRPSGVGRPATVGPAVHGGRPPTRRGRLWRAGSVAGSR